MPATGHGPATTDWFWGELRVDLPVRAEIVLPGDPNVITITWPDDSQWTFSGDYCERCQTLRPVGQAHTCKRRRSWRARLGRLCARLRRLVGVTML